MVFLLRCGILYRICIITIMRVVVIYNLDLADFTYSAASLSIWSILEPTLGIINACLPLIRPACQEVFKSNVFAWSKASTAQRKTDSGHSHRSNKPPLQSKASNAQNFHRLYDHLYPLEEVETNPNCAANRLQDLDLGSSPPKSARTGSTKSTAAIKITNSWDVRFSSRGYT